MASAQCQKPPTTTIEACQQKSNHSTLGHKISEMTHKAFKGHQARHGSTNQKPQTHCYSQTHTQHRNDDGVAKTEITLTVLQAHITTTTTTTQTDSLDHPPCARGTTTTCFGNHTKKNRDNNHHYYYNNNNNNNNNKDRNIFRRIKDGISRRNNDSNSTSSSDSDSDRENCPSRKN